MKKITLLSACMLLFTAVSAEQMQFVTTLSAPVGNFAHLDAADSTHVTSAPILNFCNTRSNVGNIVIKGANAYLKQVNIQNGTALGSTNTPEYRLSEKLTVENGGTVTAGRIMANNVTFKDTNYHKSQVTNAIYGNDIAVMGGKTDNMEISGTAKINKSAQNAANLGEELWWDNQYASDYDSSGNKKTNGKTYTSFLLKSKTAVTPDSYKFKAVIKDVQAAKICGMKYGSDTCGGHRANNVGTDVYIYADDIQQEYDLKYHNCDMCQWGKPRDVWQGQISIYKTTYTHQYGSTACPAGYTNDQICENKCDSSKNTCSFQCVKEAAKIDGCGKKMDQRMCMCPCGLNKGEAACMAVLDLTQYCDLSGKDEWKTTYMYQYVYEPLLGGTGQILTCVAE